MHTSFSNRNFPVMHVYHTLVTVSLTFLASNTAGSFSEHIFQQFGKQWSFLCQRNIISHFKTIICFNNFKLIFRSPEIDDVRRAIIFDNTNCFYPFSPVRLWRINCYLKEMGITFFFIIYFQRQVPSVFPCLPATIPDKLLKFIFCPKIMRIHISYFIHQGIKLSRIANSSHIFISLCGSGTDKTSRSAVTFFIGFIQVKLP